jgi:transcriptional regulator with XRE-family HTH domain
MPIGIGERLRAIRQRWELSLREVEERSLRFAQEHGSESHQVSASWLVRLEREKHELTVNKLISLANIYNIPAVELLHSICPVGRSTRTQATLLPKCDHAVDGRTTGRAGKVSDTGCALCRAAG